MWFLLRLFLGLAPFTAPLAIIAIWYGAISGDGVFAMTEVGPRYLKGFLATGVAATWMLMGIKYYRHTPKFNNEMVVRYKYLAGVGWSLAFLGAIFVN